MATTQKDCEIRHSDTNAGLETPTGKHDRSQQHGTHGAQDKMPNMQDVQEKAKRTAQDVASTAKDEGQRMASRAKEKAAAFLSDRQQQAATKIEGVAEAARCAAETIREQGDENVASYAESAADQVAALSRYLRDRRPNDLLRDVEDMAARHPAIVYGGLFIAGLAISRFLKASEPSQSHRNWDVSY